MPSGCQSVWSGKVLVKSDRCKSGAEVSSYLILVLACSQAASQTNGVSFLVIFCIGRLASLLAFE